MNTSTLVFLCLGLLAGALLGMVAHIILLKHQAAIKKRLPSKWPLVPRVLMNHEEYEVFKWLSAIFDDNMVMIKLPILRFTEPLTTDPKGVGLRWQELLGGVYCTFTVCTPNGSVLGCVDVQGKRGLNKSNRQLKETLLSDCRMAYTVVRPSKLPEVSTMRAAFLGETTVEIQTEAQVTRAGDSSFYADLETFSEEKRLAAKSAALKALNGSDSGKAGSVTPAAGFNPDGTGAFGSGQSSRFPS